jgi:hypothetical protein
MLLVSCVAFAVAVFALGFPDALLAAKGVQPNPELLVWVREVGALILAAGVTTFLARKSPDSVALRALFVGTALLHLGLLPIELIAYYQGVITQLGGVLPNSMLHIVLAVSFVGYARRMPLSQP